VARSLDLPLPHERDESASSAAVAPDPVIAQAKRDIDAGMVDTDMSVTPSLDAKLRSKLVPGPGGKPRAAPEGLFNKGIKMVKSTRTPLNAPATLAEEKSNFTAEGSPPPGNVSTSKPATAHDAPQTVPATKAPMRGISKLKRPSSAKHS
jgi:hypothetical protein